MTAGLLLPFALAVAVPGAQAFEPLPRMTPARAGIDPVALDGALEDLGRAPGIYSVVVIRHDAVLAERYWRGSPETLHHLASVTKSVTSTLVGVAVDRGFIPDVDVPMVDYLPPALLPDDPAKDAITLRHLLTMTSGLDFDESKDWESWLQAPNQAAFILDRPLAAPPGELFHYSTAASHLLSIVLSEAVGIPAADFARGTLFGSLGITDFRWQTDNQGFDYGGHGLWLRTEDMGKLGVLFLDWGVWEGSRVLSTGWIAGATSLQVDLGARFGPLNDIGYGWLWWLDDGLRWPVYLAWGWGGQFVFCVPALDLVVATSANWNVGAVDANRQETAILNVIVDEILPIVSHRPPRRVRVHAAPEVYGGAMSGGTGPLSGRPGGGATPVESSNEELPGNPRPDREPSRFPGGARKLPGGVGAVDQARSARVGGVGHRRRPVGAGGRGHLPDGVHGVVAQPRPHPAGGGRVLQRPRLEPRPSR
ncbi:MAG: serine hydrolase [Acidobacteria bacterium]|nr:serine hydrolase [Acidobacteriota bacterium]